jgi:hypothetical protein
MPGPAHKPIAGHVAEEIGFDPDIDAASACAIMGVQLEDLIAELNYRHRQKLVKMHAEMAQTAKASGECRILRCKEGDGGYVDLNIHPASYHFWGQRLGYECWQDAQFIREYKRDNPAAVVRTVSDRLTIVRPDLGQHSAPNRAALAPVRTGIHGRRGRWAA